MVNLASASYLRRRRVPQRLEHLDEHVLVHYSRTLGGHPPTFEYREGDRYVEREMRSVVTVNGTDAYLAACIAGLGIIQVPMSGKGKHIADGSLAEVLPDLTAQPKPVSMLHPHRLKPPNRVRAVMSWIADALAPFLR